jgi:hypothetical protein
LGDENVANDPIMKLITAANFAWKMSLDQVVAKLMVSEPSCLLILCTTFNLPAVLQPTGVLPLTNYWHLVLFSFFSTSIRSLATVSITSVDRNPLLT